MKKRVKIIGISFMVLAASTAGFFAIYGRYKYDQKMAYPVEQKIMAIYDAGQEPTDDQLKELQTVEPYRKARTVHMWLMVLMFFMIFFSLTYILFEFLVHGKKKKPLPPKSTEPRFKHIKITTPDHTPKQDPPKTDGFTPRL